MAAEEPALVDPEWLRWFRENKLFFALGTETLSVYVALDEDPGLVDKSWIFADGVLQKLKRENLTVPPPGMGGKSITFSTGTILLSIRTNVKAETLKKDWENAEAVYHFLKERGLIRPIELPKK